MSGSARRRRRGLLTLLDFGERFNAGPPVLGLGRAERQVIACGGHRPLRRGPGGKMIGRSTVTSKLRMTLLGLALASGPVGAHAACLPLGDRPTQEELDYFAVNPGSVLIRVQRDPDKLAALVTRYVEADTKLLPKVKALADVVPSRYRVAIGTALGVAQLSCSGGDPPAARAIKTFVGGVQDELLTSGYRSAMQPDGNAAKASLPVSPAPAQVPQIDEKLRLADPFQPIPIPQP